jgi:hypothetical protein
LWEGMRNPAPPFERQLDLANANRRRRVEFIDRARVKVAGGSFPMSVLVMLHAHSCLFAPGTNCVRRSIA